MHAVKRKLHYFPKLDYPSEIMEQIIQSFSKKIDEIVIDGLKLKGYYFDNKIELEAFIKENCSAFKSGNETTYFVKGKPFLIHIFKDEVDPIAYDQITGETTIKANYGEYKYL